LAAAEAQSENPESKTSRIAKRNILLRNHLEQTKDPNIVICIANHTCRGIIWHPDGSTSGIRAHFEARHPVQYTLYLAHINENINEKVCRP
jgi:hypothetical protein